MKIFSPHPRSRSAIARACLACTACAMAPAFAQQTPPQPAPQLTPVVIQGTYDNAVGSSDAASQGVVTAKLIENRPTLRPAEVLEFVPGVIVTQHSGDGKANQYFLRGFNLARIFHGTTLYESVEAGFASTGLVLSASKRLRPIWVVVALV